MKMILYVEIATDKVDSDVPTYLFQVKLLKF